MATVLIIISAVYMAKNIYLEQKKIVTYVSISGVNIWDTIILIITWITSLTYFHSLNNLTVKQVYKGIQILYVKVLVAAREIL